MGLNQLRIEPCRACDGGGAKKVVDRGSYCLCIRVGEDMVVPVGSLGTPVYWGDVSESAKLFLDRLRRCEVERNSRP